jgi:uncharacterized RDD family membrane protein YckC
MKTARLTGFATRVLAFAVDLLIIDVGALVVGGALAWGANVLGVELNPSGPVIAGLAAASWIFLVSNYLVLFWCLTGQTPGMRFMGIRVTDRRGAPPGFVRSLRRLAGMYLSVLLLGAGFLLILVDDRRRGLHDRLAGTLVIHSVAPEAATHLEVVGSSASDDALRSPPGLA